MVSLNLVGTVPANPLIPSKPPSVVLLLSTLAGYGHSSEDSISIIGFPTPLTFYLSFSSSLGKSRVGMCLILNFLIPKLSHIIPSPDTPGLLNFPTLWISYFGTLSVIREIIGSGGVVFELC